MSLSRECSVIERITVTPEAGTPSTLEEFMAAMESLAEDVEPLPRDFSREDIYFPVG